MPTNQDETLQQRYSRDHQDYLKLCGSMTAEQVADLRSQLNNALDNKEDLRDELALLKKEFGTQRGKLNWMILHCAALEGSLTIAEQRNAELRQEIAALHAINETPDENVLWDVLNATVGIITRRAYPHALESEAHNAGAKVILDRRAGLAATHLKPTESGASE